jgi:hypothetical protein
MAGSYGHCTTDDGRFRFDLIENMGDAHEACEMMWYMIAYLSEGSMQEELISKAEERYHEKVRQRGYDPADPDHRSRDNLA